MTPLAFWVTGWAVTCVVMALIQFSEERDARDIIGMWPVFCVAIPTWPLIVLAGFVGVCYTVREAFGEIRKRQL